MKRKIFISLLIFSLFSLPKIYSQDQDVEKHIQKIRKDYNLIKSQISSLEKDGSEGELYCLHTIDNKYGKSYPTVGEYKEEFWFYYDFNYELEYNVKPRLRMIIGEIKFSINNIYIETLFNENGEILFAFEQSDDIAKRLYYNENNIIRFSRNNTNYEIDDFSDEVIWIWRAADERKQRFDNFFSVVE
ncbi:MAG: hypothetical protein M0Q45_07790 [Bacteroidales bacterium]|jgi:hypothetical protein|nr:hypothetical protein [Bacteroidales bacterium]MCK9499391.1 hypothetical protein [Bacteroidales bacterium]MDY0315136.1 hypothetical protein [Bacteroidales bacterium]